MPYSDNLYSMVDEEPDVDPLDVPEHSYQARGQSTAESYDGGDDDDDRDSQVLAPTDGYFGGGPSTWQSVAPVDEAPPLSNIPSVPNVWVHDPSLEQGSTAENKAREARQERLAQDELAQNMTPAHPADSRLPYPGPGHEPLNHNRRLPGGISGSTSSRATHHAPSSTVYTPSTTDSYTSHTHHHQHHPYSQRPSFTPLEAPPAYSPSPATVSTSPPASQPQGNPPTDYNTFSQPSMGREETQGLLARHPQSMADADGEFGDAAPTWHGSVRRRVPRFSWPSGRTVLLGIVLLALTLGFLVSMVTSARNEARHKQPSKQPSPENPPAKQPQKGPGVQPPNADYPDIGNIPWDSRLLCKDVAFKDPSYEFDLSFGPGKSLSITEGVRHDDDASGRSVRVSGDVVIRRSTQKTPKSSMEVHVITNDERVSPEVLFDSDSQQSLHLTVPRVVPWDDPITWPCLRIQVIVWVPAHGVLNNLSVDNVNLAIRLLNNLSLRVDDITHLASVVGPVVAAQGTSQDVPVDGSAPPYYELDSRWIEAKTTSGDIRGYWPLYDHLDLESTSGKIQIGVGPQEAKETTPKPAILNVKTTSGDVEIREPLDNDVSMLAPSQRQSGSAAEKQTPPRDYLVAIDTKSGHIRGAVAFGSAAAIHSISGTEDLDLLPVIDIALADKDTCAYLDTTSTSGRTAIQIRNPLWFHGSRYIEAQQAAATSRPLRCLQTRHTTTSSAITLEYPETWEGDLSLSTMSGKLSVTGKDVHNIGGGSDWPGVNKKLKARRGAEGGSYATLKSTSGNIMVHAA